MDQIDYGAEIVGFSGPLVMASTAGLAAIDRAGCVVAWNAAARRITGRTASQAVGVPLSELLGDCGHEDQGTSLQTALREHRPWGTVLTIPGTGGQVSRVDVTVAPLDAEDPVAGYEVCLAPGSPETAGESATRFGGVNASELYRMLELLPIGCQVLDQELRYTYLNSTAVRQARRPAAELLGRSIIDCYPGIEFSCLYTALRQSLATPAEIRIENTFTYQDGKVATFLLTLQTVEAGLLILSEDVTASLSSNLAAGRVEKRLSTVAESIPGVLCSFCMRPDGTVSFPYASRGIYPIYGLTPAELAIDASRIFELMHPDDVRHVRETIDESLRTMLPWRDEFRVRSPILGEIWIEGYSTPVREPDGCIVWHGSITNVTQRKEESERLRISEERLRLALSAGEMGTYDWDMLRDRITWDRRHYELLGYDPDQPFQVEYRHFAERLHPEDLSVVEQSISQSMQQRTPYQNEARFILPDGSVKWLAGTGTFLYDDSGRAIRMLGLVQDITRRKALLRAMQESEERYRLMFALNPAPLVVYDRETLRFRAVNDSACRLYGYTAEEFLELDVPSIVHSDERAQIVTFIRGLAPQAGPRSQWRHVRRNGATIDVEVFGNDISVEGRQARLVIIQDITQRLRAENLLRAREEQLRLALSAGQMGIFDWDMRADLINWSPRQYEIFGFGSEDRPVITYKTVLDQVVPADQPSVDRRFQDCLNSCRPYQDELCIAWPDGSLHWVAVEGAFLDDEAGRAARMVGVTRDITKRKQTEIALRESEERFRILIDQSFDGIYLMDANCRIVDANSRGCQQMGYTLQELRGMSPPDFDSRATGDSMREMLSRLPEKDLLRFETTHRRKDGVEFPVEVRLQSFTLGDRAMVRAVVRDITDLKVAEEAVKASEERLRRIFNSEPECVKIMDGDGRVLDINPAGLRMIEAESRDQLLGKSVSELLVPEYREQYRRNLLRALSGEEVVQEYEIVGLHGTRRWMEQHSVLLSGAEPGRGSPQILAVTRDVTENRQAIAALAEQEQRLRTLGDNLPRGVIYQFQRFSDPDYRLVYLSEGCSDLFGVPAAAAMADADLINASIPEPDRNRVREAHLVSAADLSAMDLEHRVRLPSGEFRWIHVRAMPRLASDGSVIWDGVLLDVTDQKQLEQELRESRLRLERLSQKLMSMQEEERRHLARELHDEIGQMLTATRMFLQGLQRNSSGRAIAGLNEHLEAMDRTISGVRNLSLRLRPAQLDELGLVPALNWFVNTQIRSAGIAAELVVDPPGLQVSTDLATTCYRIVQEAVNNSIKSACPQTIRILLRTVNWLLLVSITDDGLGFDVENARRQALEGKSFGLLGMEERARLAGGEFEIQSSAQSGTSIRVWLPILDSDQRSTDFAESQD